MYCILQEQKAFHSLNSLRRFCFLSHLISRPLNSLTYCLSVLVELGRKENHEELILPSFGDCRQRKEVSLYMSQNTFLAFVHDGKLRKDFFFNDKYTLIYVIFIEDIYVIFHIFSFNFQNKLN